MTEINIGRSGDKNNIDSNKIQAGLKKEALKADAIISIFETFDQDKNGILDQGELSKFKEYIDRNANNKNLKKQVLNFLEQKFGIKYNDNTSEIIYADNSAELTNTKGKSSSKSVKKAPSAQNIEKLKKVEEYANKFYQIADNNSGYGSIRKMQNLLDENVDSQNIVEFLDAYDRENTRKGDSSIIDTITSEIMPSGNRTEQKKVLRTIINILGEAAKDAGVSQSDIDKAIDDFNKSIKAEYDSWGGTFRRTNPLEMEKAVDFLRGAIVAKRADNVEEISDKEAMSQFNTFLGERSATARQEYDQAREKEGFFAGVGDTVCGFFGCNTLEDIEKKLGDNASAVKKLANAKTEADFKKMYKQVFGINFDKNKIAARQSAIDNYQNAQLLDNTSKITKELTKKALSLDYSALTNEIKSKFNYDDATIDTILKIYSEGNADVLKNDSTKKDVLVRFLQDTEKNISNQYMELTRGKTLEQLGKDIELLNNSAFGTNDIAKDIAQFNENMVMTEMLTVGTFEVAGTIALQLVPGAGQLAAAKLAASATKWGSNAVKVTNLANKMGKTFQVASDIQKGTKYSSKAVSKAMQVGSQMAASGTSTVIVGSMNRDDAKSVMRKTLMNMSFAGAGASSSMLAPNLVKAFGLEANIAKEVAEEIMNCVSSYGITKISGDNYGKQEAFIDFATGLVMARISHVKTGNVSETPVNNHNVVQKEVLDKASISREVLPNNGQVATDKVAGRTPKSILTDTDQKANVYALLENPKGFGSRKDFNQVLAYVNTISDIGELSEFQALLNKKSMFISDKNKLSDAIQNRFTQLPEVEALAGSGDKLAPGMFNKLHAKVKSTFGLYNGSDAKIEKYLDENGLSSVAMDKKNMPYRYVEYSKEMIDAVDGKPLVVDLGAIRLSDIGKHVKSGEFCTIGNGANKKVYINNNGQPFEIHLSPDTFNRLFDMKKIATFEQPMSRNNCCTLYAKINSALSTTAGRVKLLSMFKEMPDGSVSVKTFNGREVNFPDGKPFNNVYKTKTETGSITNGSAEGPEMILQAFLVHKAAVPKAGVLSKSDINPESMLKQIGAFRSDIESSGAFLGETRTNVTSYKNPEELREALVNFVPGQDIATASWEWHAKSIVDYDKFNQVITFKDPQYAGLVAKISLNTFIKKSGTLNINKYTSGVPVDTETKKMFSNRQNSISNTKSTESKPPTREIDTSAVSQGIQLRKIHTLDDPPVHSGEKSSNNIINGVPNGYRPYKTQYGVQTFINDNFDVCFIASSGVVKKMDMNSDIQKQIMAATAPRPEQLTVSLATISKDIEVREMVDKPTLKEASQNATKMVMDELPKGIVKGDKRLGSQCYNFANDFDDWMINKRTGKLVNFSNKLRRAAGEKISGLEPTLPPGIKQVGSFENRPVYVNDIGQKWYFDENGDFVAINSAKPSSNGKTSLKFNI